MVELEMVVSCLPYSVHPDDFVNVAMMIRSAVPTTPCEMTRIFLSRSAVAHAGGGLAS
jgi:hypothetical protein